MTGKEQVMVPIDPTKLEGYDPTQKTQYLVFEDGKYKLQSPIKCVGDEPNAFELGAAVRKAGLAGR